MHTGDDFSLKNNNPSKLDPILFYAFIFGVFISILSFVVGYFIAPLGRDYAHYDSYYRSLHSVFESFDGGERFEVGFKFITYLISIIIPDNTRIYYSLIVFISLFSKYILIVIYAGNHFIKIALFFLLYMVSFMLVFEINQIREAIAIGFGFLCLYYYYKEKNVMALVSFLIAFSFHYTSVIFMIGLFAVYLVKKGKIKLLIISITLITLFSKFVVDLFESYSPMAVEYKRNYDNVTFGVTNITFLLAGIFFIYHLLNLRKEKPLSIALLMLLYFGLLFYLVINNIPVYQIRILELTEVGCLLIGINRKFNTYYDFGSALLMILIVMHKFIAYVIVNPLFGT